ncbi:MAG: D-TA family PLP-dependent enzyme [Pirellulales bacterium]|nr:D-TA family PLP-dependent enzyme [Pirellulales bacterium]
MNDHPESWLTLQNAEEIASPGLLIDPDRVAVNIQRMIEIVGGPQQVRRLRPHVKTHKMLNVARMQLEAGIDKFKTATLKEAEMVASAGAADVLLAYQPVGPNLRRLSELTGRFPETSFAAITDDVDAAAAIAQRLADPQNPFRLFIDVDCGMHRTGIELGEAMHRLREWIEQHPGVRFAGLHVYDGHIHDPSLQRRDQKARSIIAAVRQYDQEHPSPVIIGGGSPTFSTWAEQTEWQCSPGTPVFWDIGYQSDHPEFPFAIAIAILTRVISKPGRDRICLDLGYKAVSSEMPLEQRVRLPQISDARFVGQSEEHLVIETERANRVSVGDSFLAFPRHICPTVALHGFASVVRGGRATGEVWEISARDR